MRSNRYEIDMLNGNVTGGLISFFVPLMLSTMLQLLFNTMDLIVVGRFASSESLAAVGATTALINVFINLFIGISIGVNVIAARLIAYDDGERISSCVHTAMLVSVIFGVTLVILGGLFARPCLVLMGTPGDIIDRSALYLKIYFCGMPFFMVYTFGAAVLRASGDTTHPLIYLSTAGVLNVILNLVLVIVFGLDVAGVAIATVFSQFVSCILVLICLCRSDAAYKLDFKKLRIDFGQLSEILRIGVPAGIQSVVINFSNVLLQSSVNTFGADAIAGYTACHSIMGFLYAAVNSITQGCMTFTSQNLAAGKAERLKKIMKSSFMLETVVGLGLGVLCYVFGRQIFSLYSPSKPVIDCGMEIAVITYLPYVFCGYMDCFTGQLRGLGHSTLPMVLSIIGVVGIRAFWIFFIFPLHRTLLFLFVSYPFSWLFTIAMQAISLALVSKRIGIRGQSAGS